MKFATLGNILILVCSGLITVLSVTRLVIMIGLSPSLLANIATEYIIPFALALMIQLLTGFLLKHLP